jgi:hypothetical protein
MYSILHATAGRILEFGAGAGLSIAFVLGMSTNFATIRLYHLVPIHLYVLFPVVSCIVVIVVHFTMPLAIQVYEETSAMLEERTSLVSTRVGDKRFLARRIKAMIPLAGNVGTGLFDYRFFKVKKSTRVTYYYACVDYTITALLSIQL